MKIISILLFATILSGCASVDPYTGEERTAKASVMAGWGAVAGAIGGAVAGGKKGALIGAAGGAIGGMGVGAYQDAQERELRHSLEKTGVRIARDGDDIRLIMPGDITFETGKSELSKKAEEVLNSVAAVLTEFDATTIWIEGHTDSQGSESFNQLLSEARAAAVQNYFLSQEIPPERLKWFGRGEGHGVADNATAEGRAKNRRVELRLIPG